MYNEPNSDLTKEIRRQRVFRDVNSAPCLAGARLEFTAASWGLPLPVERK